MDKTRLAAVYQAITITDNQFVLLVIMYALLVHRVIVTATHVIKTEKQPQLARAFSNTTMMALRPTVYPATTHVNPAVQQTNAAVATQPLAAHSLSFLLFVFATIDTTTLVLRFALPAIQHAFDAMGQTRLIVLPVTWQLIEFCS